MDLSCLSGGETVNENKIRLHLDGTYHGPVDVNTEFEFLGLEGSLGVVFHYRTTDGLQAFAWYVSGSDLALKLNSSWRAMCSMIHPPEIEAADGRFNHYWESIKGHRGTAFLAGPCADSRARMYFHANPENTLEIPSARNDGADISFHIGQHWNLIKDYSVESDDEAKNSGCMVREAGDDKQEDQDTRERAGSAAVRPDTAKRQNTKRPLEAPASAPTAKRHREAPSSAPAEKRPREAPSSAPAAKRHREDPASAPVAGLLAENMAVRPICIES